ncbi:hypothetical protein Anas_04667, partial [Armadillidium nasatum]
KIYFLKTENDSELEKKSCGNDNKCGSQFCCVIGIIALASKMFAIGRCWRMIHLAEAYIGFCPCRSHLVCSQKSSQCEKIQE